MHKRKKSQESRKFEKIRKVFLKDLEEYNRFVGKYKEWQERNKEDALYIPKRDKALKKNETIQKMKFKDHLVKNLLSKLINTKSI
jgi:hypothetical protein